MTFLYVIVALLLLLSWGFSLAFAYTSGVGMGYQKSHAERLELMDGIKSSAIEFMERFKNGKKKEIADDDRPVAGGDGRPAIHLSDNEAEESGSE